eukprot:CAMPEP_0174378458 /NCGR_PEP_ID=MMETSP0811_2-20130205/122063_1 /TAXON_ID=73025 ORGANISM="Eutreptiella gymnastica-like, Strain CCMP1594" /NCGR_SAMPLE_ID=MMETSP0811_2 /ASSEMBLY_ACC=CAM_ASM_000667 /LENGTH=43 /DNA_ID= /DNA_START= /DNA_END= /DNA_ORIENTATION=
MVRTKRFVVYAQQWVHRNMGALDRASDVRPSTVFFHLCRKAGW